MQVRMLKNLSTEVHSIKGVHTKNLERFCIYPVKKVVFSFDMTSADLYFSDGCVEDVPSEDFELMGDTEGHVEVKDRPTDNFDPGSP